MAGEIVKVKDEKKYFDYHANPKEISKEKYLKVYEAFCKAYGLKVTDEDIRGYSKLIDDNIFKRFHPDGVEYRPMSGESKQRARLFVIPIRGHVRFHAYSYSVDNKSDEAFLKLVEQSLREAKNSKKTLDDLM